MNNNSSLAQEPSKRIRGEMEMTIGGVRGNRLSVPQIRRWPECVRGNRGCRLHRLTACLTDDNGFVVPRVLFPGCCFGFFGAWGVSAGVGCRCHSLVFDVGPLLHQAAVRPGEASKAEGAAEAATGGATRRAFLTAEDTPFPIQGGEELNYSYEKNIREKVWPDFSEIVSTFS